MSVKDVIKKSILESDMYSQAVSPSVIATIIVDLLVAVVAGLIIYAIYKKFYQGVVYSRSFAFTLVGMTVLTCMITLAISTNIIISLGMVGALSIVRFRTAIKEPLDLLYLFWAISTGIASGASMYVLLALSFVVMAILVICFSSKNDKGNNFVLVINYEGDATGDEIIKLLGKNKYSIRSKIFRDNNIELTLSVKAKNGNTVFAEKINGLSSVKNVAMIEYDGEYHD